MTVQPRHLVFAHPTRAALRLACAVMLASLSGCSLLTECRTHQDCEDGYRCHTDRRCYRACAGNACPGDAVCEDGACVPPALARPGSRGSPPPVSSSSASAGASASSRRSSSASSTAMSQATSSSAADASRASSRPASSGPTPVPDLCNGVDDDQDGMTDEDALAFVPGAPQVLATDAPAMRPAAALSGSGVTLAFAGWCTASSPSMLFVNHMDMSGVPWLGDGPCPAVKGAALGSGAPRESRHPALADPAGGRSLLAYTHQTDGGAELRVAEVGLVPAGATGGGLTITPSVRVAEVNGEYGPLDVLGAVATGPAGMLAALTQVSGGSEEQVAVHRLSGDGGTLQVGLQRTLGHSTEGEVALAALPDGFAAAWTDGTTVKLAFLDGQGQTVEAAPRSLTRVEYPVELRAVALQDGRVVVAWHEFVDQGGGERRRVVMAVAQRSMSGLRAFGTPLDTPAERGFFGLSVARATGSVEELLLTSLEAASGRLMLWRLSSRDGAACGSALITSDLPQIGHSAVAGGASHAAVIWRAGGNGAHDHNTVRALVLSRRRQGI